MESLEISKGKVDANFWKGKKVYLTGHTGFKGSWLSLWLQNMGALVKGYSKCKHYSSIIYRGECSCRDGIRNRRY